MKCLVVLAVCLAVVSAVSPNLNKARFLARRRAPFVKYTCPADPATATAADGFNMPVGNPTNVKQDDKFTYVTADAGNEKIGYDASTGAALVGDMKTLKGGDIDMCKVRPKEICKADGPGFCGALGAGYCCIKMAAGGTCKAKGVGRKYMPQLKDGVPVGDVASYAKLLTWLEGKNVKNGAAKGTGTVGTCKVADMSPTQDEIFWDKSVRKACFTWDAGAKKEKSRAPGKPAGAPDTPTLVDKNCKIIDGHHRWSQAALCSLIQDCVEPANGEIAVIKLDLEAAPVLKALIDFAKGADGWAKAGQDNANKAKLTHADADVFYQSTGAADFLEVDAKFGRTSHQSEAQAAAAFVANRREALAELDMELKGGDEALLDLWQTYHAPRLWA